MAHLSLTDRLLTSNTRLRELYCNYVVPLINNLNDYSIENKQGVAPSDIIQVTPDTN